ncbi:hypothetical protein LQ948_04440 [Jiella sp. MQZ9-1]|uniref:Uncharacterized protein n=1 Tax=Jiella flava TaxID=2816857 RepID=A0A939FXF9_9HYPH|nr:hypothetical protein [Jiella flava]MBO0661813.1 hypothetical protein [Jiella flava]MCD2470454.1 hypothetical protein [Jiella flava]
MTTLDDDLDTVALAELIRGQAVSPREALAAADAGTRRTARQTRHKQKNYVHRRW